MEKSVQDTMKFARAVADFRKWDLNEREIFLERIIAGLTTNFNRYGYYLCPCRDTDGAKERDRDIICPCEYAEDDIAEYGHCFCSLYYRRGIDQSEVLWGSIPERRSAGGPE